MNHLSSPTFLFQRLQLCLCLLLSLGSWVCLSSPILSASSPLLSLVSPPFLSYCLFCPLFLGSRTGQLLPMSRPTAMVSSTLERVKQWGLVWRVLCPHPLSPWIWVSVVDDQAWARPPKPPTFGEFLSQHKAEVKSRRRRKNSRPPAKVAPRAYRWGVPPLGRSLSHCVWVCGVRLSGSSLRVH